MRILKIFNLTCFDSCVGHSNASSSSKNLCGSGLCKVQRQHHMNTYCVTDGCIVECPRSLCFKTMWAGKKSFKDFQDRSNVCVPAMLETPRNIFGPSDVKFFTWWTTLCTGIPRRSAANFQARFPSGQMMLEPVILSRQPQTSMSFLRKFTWTLLHAPPHPTPPPDVYKTPRPSKGRGPTNLI